MDTKFKVGDYIYLDEIEEESLIMYRIDDIYPSTTLTWYSVSSIFITTSFKNGITYKTTYPCRYIDRRYTEFNSAMKAIYA